MTTRTPQRCGVCRQAGHNRRTCELADNEQELAEQSSLLDWIIDQLMMLKRQVTELLAERSENQAIIRAQQARIADLEQHRDRLKREIRRLRAINQRLLYRHEAFARFSDDTRL